MNLVDLVCKLIRIERHRRAKSLTDPSGPMPDCKHPKLEIMEDGYLRCENCGFLFRF